MIQPQLSYPPHGGYRAGGAAPGALPLPRSGLSLATVLVLVVAAIALVAPTVTAVVHGGRGIPGLLYFIKDGGIANWILMLVHPMCAIVLGTLGVFVVRGKKIPSALLIAIALFPFAIGILGTIRGQAMTFGAVSGESVAASQKLRILAEGIAESNTSLVLGSVSGALLSLTAGVALLGSVLSVDTRRMTPRPGAWITGTAVGALLAVIAIVARVLSPSWSGGVTAKLGVLVVLGAAALGGPVLARVKGIDDAQDPSEVRRVTAAVLGGAILFGLTALLLDRVAFGLAERLVLSAIAGESVDPSQRMRILGEIAPGVGATRTSMVFDTAAASLAFVPAIVASLRRPSWGQMGATVGVLVLFVVAIAGAGRYRQSKIDLVMESADRRAVGVPPDLVPLPPDMTNRSDAADDAHYAILASGEVKELLAPSEYSPCVVAPDRAAPFAPIFAIDLPGQAHARTPGRMILAGRPLLSRELAAMLGEYQGFLGPALAGYDVVVTRKIPETIHSASLWVLAISPDEARVGLVAGTAPFALPELRRISFRDVARANELVAALIASNSGPIDAVIAPAPEARAEAVYSMIQVMRASGTRGAPINGNGVMYAYAPIAAPTIYVTSDREGVERVMTRRPSR